MAKILVADDEADLEFLIKQKFRKQIRDHQYEFVFAMNGKQALERIQEHPDIDIVLSDINMPEMDGLTLLSRLHETSPLIKAVIISAYGDMENIRSAMNRGAFDFLLKPVDFNDLELTMGKTLAHVKQIRETLNAIKENNILKMYVDESVLDYMNTPDFENSVTRNEHIDATVVFVDIVGFTSIAETKPVNEVVEMLNKYFDIIVREIIGQNGHVDKFMGDAVMSVFRGENHLDRAVEACLGIRKQIDALGKESELNFMPKVSIGLNTGDLISGNIGSASLKRFDYTVIGDVVNTAQRLQSAAKPNQIIVNHHTYELIRDRFKCEDLGQVTLKNKSVPAQIYNVLD
jgi:class 3 adenylate cyclase/AmiR/NasT family two-component response regulator